MGKNRKIAQPVIPTDPKGHAKSELGRHEEAIDDYGHAVHLDPALASASGDG